MLAPLYTPPPDGESGGRSLGFGHLAGDRGTVGNSRPSSERGRQMPEFYHTIVIGAGPAGLTAARYLDGALVIEANRRIGHPVRCAEGLSAHGLAALGIESDERFIAGRMRRTEMVLPGGGMLAMDGEGYILDSEPFERSPAAQVRGPLMDPLCVRSVGLGPAGRWRRTARRSRAAT